MREYAVAEFKIYGKAGEYFVPEWDETYHVDTDSLELFFPIESGFVGEYTERVNKDIVLVKKPYVELVKFDPLNLRHYSVIQDEFYNGFKEESVFCEENFEKIFNDLLKNFETEFFNPRDPRKWLVSSWVRVLLYFDVEDLGMSYSLDGDEWDGYEVTYAGMVTKEYDITIRGVVE